MCKTSIVGVLVATWLFAGPAVAELGSSRLSLPKGPGSIEGLASANFAPNLASGQASYSIPIAVPPGARSFGPSLALTYDSGAGVSELGVGWRLSGVPSVRRRTQDGLPRFDDTDRFEVVGLGTGAELLEVRQGIYRPRYEDGSFLRAERGHASWEVRTKPGLVLVFGGEECMAQEGGKVATYLLRAAHDRRGHEVRYEWRTAGGYPLLERVVWNDFSPESKNEIRFEYESRPDPSRLFSSGIRQVLDQRLLSVSVQHGGQLVRRYELSYTDDAHPRLASVVLVGVDGVSRLPATRFRYSSVALAGSGSSTALVEMQEAPGRSPGEGDASLVDLNGDGLPDLLIGGAGAYQSAINVDGVHWEPGRDWTAADSPSFSLSASGVQLADFDGDGAADLLTSGGGAETRYLAHASETAFGEEIAVDSSLDLSFEDPNVRLADFDGDRRTDFAMTTSAGFVVARNRDGVAFEPAESKSTIDADQEVLFERAGTDLCDVNGDRVPDVCVLLSGSLVYYLGRGRGAFEPAQAGSGVPEFEASEPFALRDLDGDGWDDLVRAGVSEVTYALAKGEGQFGAVLSIRDVPTKGPSTFTTFADMNGSGSVDLVWVDVSGSGAASWRYLDLFPEGRAGLLTEIDSGLGKTQTIEYASAASFAAKARQGTTPWTSRLNVAMPVVAKLTVSAGLGDPDLVQEYRYADGVYDANERTFAAFARSETRAIGDESTPTLVTERHFEVGLSRRHLRGAVLFEESRTDDGDVFSRSSHEYADRVLGSALDGRVVEYGYRSALLTEGVEGDEETSVVTLSEFEQDEFGNVTVERNWGVIDGDDYLALADEAITERTFSSDPDEWVLGYLATETLRNGSGETVAGTRRYYDGAAFEGLELGQVRRGELTREEAWLGPAADAFQLVTATRYDADGLPVETKDARGGGRFFTWDDAHTMLTSEGVKLRTGDEPGSPRLVERARFDGRFGTLVEVTDYAGSVTRYDYDAFGRLTTVVQPGDSRALPTLRHSYEEGAPLSRIVTEARLESGQAAVELREDLFDGLGRKRASFVLDAELWLLAGVSIYDARGHVRRTLLPRWVSEVDRRAPPLEDEGDGYEVWRDALGREVETQSAEGIVTRSSYAPLRVLHWDGGQADEASSFEHTPTVTVSDGLGRTIRHERVLDGITLAASYAYDAASHLTTRTDPEGNVQRFRYDGRGRRLGVDDPDQGRHRFFYDGTGNLLEHEYPDQQRTTFTYDLADRLLTEDWDGDGTAEIVQEYDQGPTAHLGKLTRVIEPSGLLEHTYDERGRVTETLYRIEGQDYRVGSRFDAQGREIEHIYPDGSRLDIRRNARGQLSGYGQLLRIEYGAQGAETLRRFSTGVELRNAHDRDNRRTGFELRDVDGEAVEHLTWNYDQGGNLATVVDERVDVSEEHDRSETYFYDNLYRLTGVSGTWGSTEWTYSASGNLLGRTSTLEGQHAPSVRYGKRPHGPTALGQRKIAYDARGRMTSDGARSYTWDGASQLVRATSADARVESIYGQDGARRVKRETGPSGVTSTTHFIDAWSEVNDGRLVRYVVHAGERVVRLADGPRDAGDAHPGLGGSGGPHSWLVCLVALLVLLTLLVRRWRRARLPGELPRVVPSHAWVGILVSLVTAGLLTGCSPVEAGVAAQAIERLVRGDVLLVTEQVGSLLGEFDEYGRRRSEVALAPYGLARHDASSETRKYAGSPRDGGVGLDHMGARFYAPDLGVWTSADAVSLSDPAWQVTAEFAAAHSYAYANLRPLIAVDRDGRFWHVAIGALVGAVVDGGLETLSQYLEHGKIVDGGRIRAAAIAGALTGTLVALNPGAGLAWMAGADVTGGFARRAIASGGSDLGTLTDVAADTLGAVGGKSLELLGAAGKKGLQHVTGMGGGRKAVGYHATRPDVAESILKDGFRSGSRPGRLGCGGVYVNDTPAGARAEYSHHNPGADSTVLRVEYDPGVRATAGVAPRKYVDSHPVDADTLSAPSLRAPGSTNTNILNGSARGTGTWNE